MPNNVWAYLFMGFQFRIIKLISYVAFLSAIAFPAAYILFDLKKQSLIQTTTESFIDDMKFAQKTAIKNNYAVTVSAINGDWSKGWNLYSADNHLIKTSLIDSNLINSNSASTAKIVFRPSGLTNVLQPLGSDGLFFCDKEGQGNQLKMIASGFVSVTNLKQDCLA